MIASDHSNHLHRDLVLVGGGHSHALAIRMLAMKPVKGLRITLVSQHRLTPYSGMLPGLVAGHYRYEAAHIDLDRLCQWAQVRFIAAEVIGLDPQARVLQLAGRPDLGYDVVSLDIGSQPELDSVPGARDFAIPVKPVSGFWERWQSFLQKSEEGGPIAISLVGGGAGSVELALAMAHALSHRPVSISLWCGGPEILPGYNAGARRKVNQALARLNVIVHTDARVTRVSADTLHTADSTAAHFDALFWCTAAAAAPWVATSGLPVDDQGFLQVSDTLQSLGDERVFAAGDIATQVNHPRPKAGVYAVRQAPALVRNLRALVLEKPLRPFQPQQNFLSLVSLGPREAVAEKAFWSAAGGWVWRWKDRIDSRFMQQFEQLPVMRPRGNWGELPEVRDSDSSPPCGGCGAKLGADVLHQALAALAQRYPALIAESAEDAALIPNAAGLPMLQSVDVLRELVPDPWQMGRIAALHALSDLYACGARPVSALAVVTLPFSAERVAQRDLQQLLAGALHEFSQVNCVLSGGHTLQGPELSVGFVVNGASDGQMLDKRGAQPGDALVLTKPLGIGVLFAARMQGLAAPADLEAAVQTMLISNRNAATLATGHGAHACTDVTGFGLAGHLSEMLGDRLAAQVHAAAVPALPGALTHLADGVFSTMAPSNMRSVATHTQVQDRFDEARHILVFDPQTSGGLLIACPQDKAQELVNSLRAEDCEHAAIIGLILETSAGGGAAGEAVAPNLLEIVH